MGHDVFVSHSSKDKAAADAVCAALESNGIRCWIAPRDIAPGENWATSILNGIAGSRMMVLVFSDHCNGSEHIRREVERAVHRGIPIAPIRIQEVMPKNDLEYFLSSSHWMDALTPPLAKHLRELARKVRGLLELEGAAAGAAPDLSAAVAERLPPRRLAAPPRRRGRAAVLVALALTAAGLAAAWAFRGDLSRRWADAFGPPPTQNHSVAPSPADPGAGQPSPAIPTSAPSTHPATRPTATPPAPPETAEASAYRQQQQRLAGLKDLFLAERISPEIYQLGTQLLRAGPAGMDEYDSTRLAQFVAVLEGRLTAEKLPAALSAIDLAGKEFTNSLAMKFKRIEPGTFTMGSPEAETGRLANEAQHEVRLTKAFLMGIHHVTRGQFAAFVKDAGYQTDAEKDGWAFALNGDKYEKVNGASWKAPGFDQADDHPVVEVSWNDAGAFCAWLSRKEGRFYRLPTEAEWEYACRAGTRTAYFWGDDPDRGAGFANCADLTAKDKFPAWTTFNWRDGFVYTSPVGSFKPNPWGLYDMIGNAFEWCSDVYGDYPAGAVVDPQGSEQKPNAPRVLRGGSWHHGPGGCRSAYRIGHTPDDRGNGVGFRVVLDSH